MPGITFAQLRSHVLSAMSEYVHGNLGMRSVDADMAATWVKLAHYKLDADLRWSRCRAYINGVRGQRYYTLSPGFHEILVVTYAGKPLERITSQEEIVLQDARDTTGTPVAWAWWGPDIALYPQPDESVGGVIGLYVVTTPDELVDDDDTPTLPAHLQPLLLDYALSLGYRHVGDVDRAVGYMNLYTAAIESERYKTGNDRGTDNRVSEDVI